jgi:hypothetical protein
MSDNDFQTDLRFQSFTLRRCRFLTISYILTSLTSVNEAMALLTKCQSIKGGSPLRLSWRARTPRTCKVRFIQISNPKPDQTYQPITHLLKAFLIRKSIF